MPNRLKASIACLPMERSIALIFASSTVYDAPTSETCSLRVGQALAVASTATTFCTQTTRHFAKAVEKRRTETQPDFRTERILPAGSLNQAMVGPFPRMIPFSSVFKSP